MILPSSSINLKTVMMWPFGASRIERRSMPQYWSRISFNKRRSLEKAAELLYRSSSNYVCLKSFYAKSACMTMCTLSLSSP